MFSWDFALDVGSKSQVSFQKASEFEAGPPLRFGFDHLDRLIGGLNSGQTVFLHGSSRCLTLSEILCVRVQLKHSFGGLDSKAMFIDAGNMFDPYFITEYTAEHHPELLDDVLDRILVLRTFTCHQLTTFIAKNLQKEIHRHGVKLVVISDMVTPYCEPDIDLHEGLDLLKVSLNYLTSTVNFERVATLLTSIRRTPQRHLLAVKSMVDIVARVENDREYLVRVVLEKHPNLAMRELSGPKFYGGDLGWVGRYHRGGR
ncbi:hypothetical protein KEJ51_06575 [Candidatus Bathyarchaeota archaeon]|nr:hypothetical protein [Candidatus Bathyarchaeota archaeon]